MQQLILDIIENQSANYFQFNRNSNNSIKHLKEQTSSVPNEPGLYLVFCPNNTIEGKRHLKFEINNNSHVLLYFGKAGGITKNGKVIKQGLNGRINNVVSDSFRNLKDVKRANYWEIVMTDYNIERLYIIYFLNANPQKLEDIIYNFLDENNLEYPLMNKKRGR